MATLRTTGEYNGQKLIWSNKPYEQIKDKITEEMANAIVITADGYIRTHDKVFRGAVDYKDMSLSVKDGKLTIVDGFGVEKTVDLPTVTGTDLISFELKGGSWVADDSALKERLKGIDEAIKAVEDKVEGETGLNSQISTINEKLKDIDADIESINEEVESLKSKDEKLEELISTNAGEIESIKTDIEGINTRISDNEASIAANTEAIKTETSKREEADTELSSKIDDNVKATATAQAAAEAAQAKADANASKLAQEIIDRTEADNKLQADINDAKTSIEAEVERAKAAEDELKSSIETAQAGVDTNTGDISTLKTKTTSLEGRMDSAESKLNTVDSRIDKAKTEAIASATTLANNAKADAISTAEAYTDEVVDAHANEVATADKLGHVLINDDYTTVANDGQAIAASTKAVQSAVDAAKSYADAEIKNKIAAADAMRFKGTISSSDVPTDAANGDTYKATESFTVDGQTVEAGDMLIWNEKENAWNIIQANIDGAVTASEPLNSGGIVIGGGNKTVKTVNVGKGLQIGDNGLEVKLGATNNDGTGELAVKTDGSGNLIVDASNVNTWRTVEIDGVSTNVDPLKFGGNFTLNNGYVDLAWFELD